MTALFGIIDWTGANAEQDAERMGTALGRYGRDSADRFVAGAIVMGRNLHAMLPEDANPFEIAPRERRYAVVADVRLTERDDLLRQLGFDYEGWSALSDADIVALAVERWNEHAFDRIYGAFAIAAWDRRDRRLLLARDFHGERPLFYHAGPTRFAFASMPEGLQTLDDVPNGADEEQYFRLLRMLPLAPGRTTYEAVGRVMPGDYVVVTQAGIATHRHWKPDFTPLVLPTQQDYERALSARLDAAVAASLRGAERRVAAHLSGGFDSTAVATTAARLLAPSGGRVIAFTAAPIPDSTALYDHQFADESGLAGETAAMHANIDHFVVRAETGLLDSFDRTTEIYAQPIPNICNLNWNDAILDRIRDMGLRVVLQGSAGNMTISDSGTSALPLLLRAGRLGAWFRTARGLVRTGWMQWRGVVWNSVAQFASEPVQRWVEAKVGRTKIPWRSASLLTDAAYEKASADAVQINADAAREDVFELSEFAAPSGPHDLKLQLFRSNDGHWYKSQLAEWRVDVRDPTADRRLVEWSLRVPVERLVWDGEPRAILRKVLADRAPASVLDTRKRGYQGADWVTMLYRSRPRLIDEIERIKMFDPAAALIDVERLDRLIRDMPAPDSDAWEDEEMEVAYRSAILVTVAVVGHMRRTAGSNY